MKKSIPILNVVMGLVFCFAVATICFATPVTVSMNGLVIPDNLEMIMKKPERPKHNFSLSSLKNNDVQDPAIDNCVQSPDLDENKNGYCVKYELNITFKVPPEGATFYSIYYLRIKNGDGSWSEWRKIFTGDTRFWSQEDAENNYVEFLDYLFGKDNDIPPSIAQFKVEMYNDSDVLKDVFETSNNKHKYWFPARIESDNYDLEDSS